MKLSNRKLANPFIYQGYESPEYFCDRIRKRILGDKHHEFQEVLPEIQRVNNSSDMSEEFKKQKQQTLSAESSLLPQKGQALPDLF